MTRTRSGASRAPAVLVFGENLNDSSAIAELLVAINPALAGRVHARPRPTSLTRDANPPAIRRWTDELRRSLRATEAAGTRVSAVLVHRDADGPDPAGAAEEKLGAQLAVVPGRPVVPVQAIEAWWFLFPDAVEAVRPIAWRGRLPRTARDVETISAPKAELVRVTRKSGKDAYSEGDSPVIAGKVRSMSPQQYGTSTSFQRFTALARSL